VRDNLDPKIGNFRYARDADSNISTNLSGLITDILRWMSPELIKKYKQNKYEERVYTFNSWHHTPHQRIALTNLHSILEALAVKYPTSPTQTPLQDKPKNFVRPMGEENLSVCFEMPVTPLEKGIKFHQAKDYKNAWKGFEENANLDIKLAKKLFKEAADNNHIIAQVRYAVALLSDLRKDDDEATKEDNRNQILHYFKLAAEKENADAMYYLGDIYVHGKLKVQQNNENRDLGIKYLKLAADNNHENAK
ncbi:18775_t:CDS:2, partial [Gigaspora margarita]